MSWYSLVAYLGDPSISAYSSRKSVNSCISSSAGTLKKLTMV